jgi:hypothetical protein
MSQLVLKRKKNSTLSRANGRTVFFIALAFIASIIGQFLVRIENDALILIGGVLTIAFFVLLGVATWSFRKQMRDTQALRDAQWHEPGPKAVYLRTFDSDKSVAYRNPFWSWWTRFFLGPLAEIVDPAFIRAELFVTRVLEPYIVTIQVGGKDPSGARINLPTGDETWWRVVADITDRCNMVVILPMLARKGATLHGKSTMWELRHLMETGKLGKTALLMPPGRLFRTNRMRTGWTLAQERARAHGLALPDYDPSGAVLLFARQGGVWRESARYTRVSGPKKRRFGQALLDALLSLSEDTGFGLLDTSRERAPDQAARPSPAVAPAAGPAGSPRLFTPPSEFVRGGPAHGLVFDGLGEGGRRVRFTISPQEILFAAVIGRSTSEGVFTIEDGLVSRRHARIGWARQAFTIEDLGSTNGTSVNGARLAANVAHPLKPGDVVRLGRLDLTVSAAAP